MEPTEKSSGIDKLLEGLTGRNRPDSIRQGICTTCGGSADSDEFKDALSRKEYAISGMCQVCQDKVFGK